MFHDPIPKKSAVCVPVSAFFPLMLKNFFALVLIVMFCFGQKTMAEEQKEWTLMVYMCADNDLEESALLDFLEMEQGVHDDVNILVLMDRSKGYTQRYDNWAGTRMYRIKKARDKVDYSKILTNEINYPSEFESQLLKDYGELDMSDPQNLISFVKESVENFPAKRYALIPWNHGGGWKSMIMDQDGGKGVKGRGDMTVYQFADALKRAAIYLPSGKFDAIIFEMCLMGQVDVLDTLAPYTDYVFAAPPVMPAVGIDYTNVLPFFRAGVSTRDLMEKIVNSSTEFLVKNHLLECAYSAYDMRRMPKLTEALNRLNSQLNGFVDRFYNAFASCLSFCVHVNSVETDVAYGKPAYWSVSLEDWIRGIESSIQGVDRKLIENVRSAIDELIVAKNSTPNASTKLLIFS